MFGLFSFLLPLQRCCWFCSSGLKGALAPCRAERMRSSANPFLVSAVRVFNTFNTFNRFSTKCCTMIFVILTDFQHFNNFSTNLSTVFFAFYLRFSVKFLYFSTFPHSLLLRLQQVNIILRVCVHALRVRARALIKPSILLDRYWAR